MVTTFSHTTDPCFPLKMLGDLWTCIFMHHPTSSSLPCKVTQTFSLILSSKNEKLPTAAIPGTSNTRTKELLAF